MPSGINSGNPRADRRAIAGPVAARTQLPGRPPDQLASRYPDSPATERTGAHVAPRPTRDRRGRRRGRPTPHPWLVGSFSYTSPHYVPTAPRAEVNLAHCRSWLTRNRVRRKRHLVTATPSALTERTLDRLVAFLLVALLSDCSTRFLQVARSLADVHVLTLCGLLEVVHGYVGRLVTLLVLTATAVQTHFLSPLRMG